MEFIDTKKTNALIVKSASKSRLATHGKCALRAYKDLRSVKAFNGGSTILDIGNIAHEMANREVQLFMGKELEEYKPEFGEYSMEAIFEFQETIQPNLNRIHGLLSGHAVIASEESFSIEMENIGEGFRFIAKPDAVAFTDIDGESYIHVFEWKTGFTPINVVDDEAILYGYAAYKKYNLPVIFTRVNLRTGGTFAHVFKPASLEAIEGEIFKKIAKFKKEMESEVSPEFVPGAHCSHCPYIMQCDGRKYAHSLQQKFKVAVWAKALAARNEGEVKAAAAEILALSPEETVLVPFLDDKFGVEAQHSETIQLAGRKVSKKDIFKMLIASEQTDLIADSINFKFTPELKDVLEGSFGVKTKTVNKTVIKLVVNKDELEDEEDE